MVNKNSCTKTYLNEKSLAMKSLIESNFPNAKLHFQNAYDALDRVICEEENVKAQKLLEKFQTEVKSYINLINNRLRVKAVSLPDGKVFFKDVVGLSDAIEEIKLNLIYQEKYPEIYKVFKKNQANGILLYGLPGTGKTMLAKTLANELGYNLISVKCSDIKSKWFGESEQNINSIFKQAKNASPSILFFDEFDSLGSARDIKHIHDSQLVTELLDQLNILRDSMEKVIVVAATNRPWDLDSALIRPGRFDMKIHIGLPNKNERKELLLRNLKDVPYKNLNIDQIIEQTEKYSPVDMIKLADFLKCRGIQKSIKSNEIIPIDDNDVSEYFKQVRTSIKLSDISEMNQYLRMQN